MLDLMYWYDILCNIKDRPFRLKPKCLCNISIEVSLTAVKSPINVYILAQGPDNSRDLCSAA